MQVNRGKIETKSFERSSRRIRRTVAAFAHKGRRGAMVDVKLRYLVFVLLMIVGLVLAPSGVGEFFVGAGLAGITGELQLSRDRDREILRRALEETARKAEHQRELEILREFEKLFPPQQTPLPAESAPLIM
jgi:hypothetical protein